MQRSSFYSLYFLFVALIALTFGCEKEVIERPEPNAGSIQAIRTEVDLSVLEIETRKISREQGMTLVWWVPVEYWQASFAQNPLLTANQAKEAIEALKSYMTIVVLDGELNVFGEVTYRSESKVRAVIQIKDENGTSYSPLSEGSISSYTQRFLSMAKPTFTEAFGQMGQNTYIFVFPARDRTGQRIADPKKEGTFSVVLGNKELKWRLPLGSLLPPKICPVDGEKMNGAWKYCPWHGDKLLENR